MKVNSWNKQQQRVTKSDSLFRPRFIWKVVVLSKRSILSRDIFGNKWNCFDETFFLTKIVVKTAWAFSAVTEASMMNLMFNLLELNHLHDPMRTSENLRGEALHFYILSNSLKSVYTESS